MSDNIHVAVRVRPLIAREKNEKCIRHWDVCDNTIYNCDENGKSISTPLAFDRVYNSHECTIDVFKDMAMPIAESAIDGINGSIFAYGQTSSGKTFTMMGDKRSPGIIGLTIDTLFDLIDNVHDREFLLRVSYIEIYNETICDLLSADKRNLKVHENREGLVYVSDLREHTVRNPEEILQLIRQGEQNRHFGVTNMNEKSSRSHTIFQMVIESRSRKDLQSRPDSKDAVKVSHLNLVDLAGSERSGQTKSKGDRFKEGCSINLSLFTLSQVIRSLSEGQSYVNFRGSNLTRILQSSLGGNARTVMICNVTPAEIEQTFSTLNFASRAKRIKNKPKVNEVLSDEAVLKQHGKKIADLTKQLENETSAKESKEKQLEEKQRINEDLEKEIKALKRKLIVSRDESNPFFPNDSKSSDSRRKTWCAPSKKKKRLSLAFHLGRPLCDGLDLEQDPMENFQSSSDFDFGKSDKLKNNIRFQRNYNCNQTNEGMMSPIPAKRGSKKRQVHFNLSFPASPENEIDNNSEFYKNYADEVSKENENLKDLLNTVQREYDGLEKEHNELKEYTRLESSALCENDLNSSGITENLNMLQTYKSRIKILEKSEKDLISEKQSLDKILKERFDSNSDADEKYPSLMEYHHELQKNLENKCAELAKIFDENKMLQSTIEEKNLEMKELNKKSNELEIVKDFEISKLKSRNEEIIKQLNSANEKLEIDDSNKLEIQNLQKSIESLNQSLTTERQKFQEELMLLNKTHSDLENEIAALNQSLNSERQQNEQEIEKQNKLQGEYENKIDALNQSLLKEREEHLDELQKIKLNFESEIEDLNKSIVLERNELKTEIEKLSQVHNEFKDKVENSSHLLQKEREEYKFELEKVKLDFEGKIESLNQSSVKETNEFKTEIEKLNQVKSHFKSEIDALNETLIKERNEHVSEVEKLNQSKEDIESKFGMNNQSLQDENKELKNNIKTITTNFESEIETLNQCLLTERNQYKSEVERLHLDLEHSKKNLVNAEAEINKSSVQNQVVNTCQLVDELYDKIEKITHEKNEALRMMDDQNSELKDLKATVSKFAKNREEAFESEYQNQITSSCQLIDELYAQIECITLEKNEILKKLTEAELHKPNIQNQVTDTCQLIDELYSKIESTSCEKNNAIEKIKDQSMELNSLKNSLKKLVDVDISDLNAQIESITSEKNEALKKLEAQVIEIKDLKAIVNEFENAEDLHKPNVQDQVTATCQLVDELHAEIKSVTCEKNELIEKLNCQSSELKELRDIQQFEETEIKLQKSNVQNQVMDRCQVIDKLYEQIESLTMERDEVMKNLMEQSIELKDLKNTVTQLTEAEAKMYEINVDKQELIQCPTNSDAKIEVENSTCIENLSEKKINDQEMEIFKLNGALEKLETEKSEILKLMADKDAQIKEFYELQKTDCSSEIMTKCQAIEELHSMIEKLEDEKATLIEKMDAASELHQEIHHLNEKVQHFAIEKSQILDNFNSCETRLENAYCQIEEFKSKIQILTAERADLLNKLAIDDSVGSVQNQMTGICQIIDELYTKIESLDNRNKELTDNLNRQMLALQDKSNLASSLSLEKCELEERLSLLLSENNKLEVQNLEQETENKPQPTEEGKHQYIENQLIEIQRERDDLVSECEKLREENVEIKLLKEENKTYIEVCHELKVVKSNLETVQALHKKIELKSKEANAKLDVLKSERDALATKCINFEQCYSKDSDQDVKYQELSIKFKNLEENSHRQAADLEKISSENLILREKSDEYDISIEEYSRLQEEYDDLINQKMNVDAELEKLRSNCAELQKVNENYNKLLSEYEQLQAEFEETKDHSDCKNVDLNSIRAEFDKEKQLALNEQQKKMEKEVIDSLPLIRSQMKDEFEANQASFIDGIQDKLKKEHQKMVDGMNEDHNTEIEALKNEIDELSLKIKDYTDSIEEIQSSKNQLNNKIVDLNMQIENGESALADSVAEKEILLKNIDLLKAQNESKDRENEFKNELQLQVVSLKEIHETELGALKSRIDELELKNSDYANEIEEIICETNRLKEEIESNKIALANAIAEKESLLNDIDSLKFEKNEDQNLIKELRDRSEMNEEQQNNEISELRAKITDLDLEVKQLTTDSEKMISEKESLMKENNKLGMAKDDSENHLKVFEEKFEKEVMEKGNLISKYEECKSKLLSHEKYISELQIMVEKIFSEKEALTDEIVAMKSDYISKKNAIIEENNEKLAKLNEQLEADAITVSELRNQCDSITIRNTDLLKEHENVSKKLKEQDIDLAGKVKEIEDLSILLDETSKEKENINAVLKEKDVELSDLKDALTQKTKKSLDLENDLEKSGDLLEEIQLKYSSNLKTVNDLEEKISGLEKSNESLKLQFQKEKEVLQSNEENVEICKTLRQVLSKIELFNYLNCEGHEEECTLPKLVEKVDFMQEWYEDQLEFVKKNGTEWRNEMLEKYENPESKLFVPEDDKVEELCKTLRQVVSKIELFNYLNCEGYEEECTLPKLVEKVDFMQEWYEDQLEFVKKNGTEWRNEMLEAKEKLQKYEKTESKFVVPEDDKDEKVEELCKTLRQVVSKIELFNYLNCEGYEEECTLPKLVEKVDFMQEWYEDQLEFVKKNGAKWRNEMLEAKEKLQKYEKPKSKFFVLAGEEEISTDDNTLKKKISELEKLNEDLKVELKATNNKEMKNENICQDQSNKELCKKLRLVVAKIDAFKHLNDDGHDEECTLPNLVKKVDIMQEWYEDKLEETKKNSSKWYDEMISLKEKLQGNQIPNLDNVEENEENVKDDSDLKQKCDKFEEKVLALTMDNLTLQRSLNKEEELSKVYKQEIKYKEKKINELKNDVKRLQSTKVTEKTSNDNPEPKKEPVSCELGIGNGIIDNCLVDVYKNKVNRLEGKVSKYEKILMDNDLSVISSQKKSLNKRSQLFRSPAKFSKSPMKKKSKVILDAENRESEPLKTKPLSSSNEKSTKILQNVTNSSQIKSEESSHAEEENCNVQ